MHSISYNYIPLTIPLSQRLPASQLAQQLVGPPLSAHTLFPSPPLFFLPNPPVSLALSALLPLLHHLGDRMPDRNARPLNLLLAQPRRHTHFQGGLRLPDRFPGRAGPRHAFEAGDKDAVGESLLLTRRLSQLIQLDDDKKSQAGRARCERDWRHEPHRRYPA